MSNVSGARRGDGLAARAHLPHAGGGRRSYRSHADSRAPSRPLPRLPRLRDSLPFGGALRPAPRGDAGAARAQRCPRSGKRSRDDAVGTRDLPASCASRTAPLGAQALPGLRSSGDGPRLRHPRALPEAQGHGVPSSQRGVVRIAACIHTGPRQGARPGGASHGLRPALLLRRRQCADRTPPLRRRVGCRRAGLAGMLRGASSTRGRRASCRASPTMWT